ncbi:MAG TPA: FAD-dependent oxidoreductase [Anaerolineales bacterium]|jgi:sarcosine oxidase subunit beta
MRASADVVIIGGGVVGCASAYYLARSGLSVTLFEKAPQVGQEASGVNAGGVRQHGRDSAEMPLAIRAIEMWQTLGDELDFDLEYVRGGHLRFASNESEFEDLRRSVAEQQALGLEDIILLDRRDVLELVPDLSLEIVGASYCPSDGHANPQLVCPAFARAAVRHGASIQVGTKVTSIQPAPGGGFALRTAAGSVSAANVINSAGAWVGRVARMVNVEVPLEPRYWQSMVTEPLAPFLRPVLTWAHVSKASGNWRNLNLKQLKPGQLLISGAWTGQGSLESMARATVPEGVMGSARDFVRLFPHLRHIQLRRAWVGVDGHPPDNVIIFGPVDAIPGFYLAGPGSGHGFALGPAMGEALTELITVGGTRVPINGLNLNRFTVVGA